jgi:hypothetical protein
VPEHPARVVVDQKLIPKPLIYEMSKIALRIYPIALPSFVVVTTGINAQSSI